MFYGAPDKNASHNHWWNEAEPIWVNAEKHGIRTSMYWWDGCQVRIRGILPSKCVPYADNVEFTKKPIYKKRVMNGLTQLLDDIKHNNYSLGMVYYEAVDAIGMNSFHLIN